MRTPLLALLLVSLALPASAYDLGGECLEAAASDASSASELVKRTRERDAALKAGDSEAAIAAQKGIVRLRCKESANWYRLARLHLDAGDEQAAVAVLEEAHMQGMNDVAYQLWPPEADLHSLYGSEAYTSSRLAIALTFQRDAAAMRREQYYQTLDAVPEGERPQGVFVSRGRCPKGCCDFANWPVARDTTLVDRPGSYDEITTVPAGTRASALDDQLHLDPPPIGVVFPVTPDDYPHPIEIGSVVFLIEERPDGRGQVWYRGQPVTVDVRGLPMTHDCHFPSERCWGERLVTDEHYNAEGHGEHHWIRLRLADGTTGWTRADTVHGGYCDAEVARSRAAEIAGQ